MSTLQAFLVTALLFNFVPTQGNDNVTPSDLVIVKFSWNPYLNLGDLDNAVPSADERNVGATSGAPVRPEPESKSLANATRGFQYKLRTHNRSTKTITGIVWDYVFLDAEGSEVGRHHFRSNKDFRIGPGKTKDIIEFSKSQPSSIVSAKSPTNEKNLPSRIEIDTVYYSDGSIWKRNQ